MLSRTASIMASATGAAKSSPFSNAVFSAMRKLYPEHLADKSFDNTGLLLEAPYNPASELKNSVLLTIDLTTAVAQEAIDKKASVVVAYHPIIFRGLKQLSLANSQQASLLRLAAQGISVYSPHTAVDAAPGGNADWMADIVTAESTLPLKSQSTRRPQDYIEACGAYHLTKFPRSENASKTLKLNSYPHVRSIVHPNATDSSAGMGRVIEFETPRPLHVIVSMITAYFDNPPSLSLARASGKSINDIVIGSIGICAGSGASVLSGVNVDLIVTGEISHHEALAAVESRKSVIAFGHSDSERGYLSGVMRDKLREALKAEWAVARNGRTGKMIDADSVFRDAGVEVEVSSEDTDPFGTLLYNSQDLEQV